MPGLVLAVIGAAVAVVCGLGSGTSRSIFFHAYLVAFVFYLTITLGSLFFVLLRPSITHRSMSRCTAWPRP